MTDVKTTVTVTDETLRNLLTGALEGGSSYWYVITGCKFAEGIEYTDFCKDGKYTLEEYWNPYELIPFVKGCGLVIADQNEPEEDRKEFILDREALERGIQVMAEKYPQHFANIVSEDWDGETADVYLQCCLFSEIIFG